MTLGTAGTYVLYTSVGAVCFAGDTTEISKHSNENTSYTH
jgi:hypothetical protein